jgi:glutathione S-transferase
MLKFFFSKGSSALAAHILLEESGAPYTTCEVSIAEGAHKTPAFLAVNPKGRLPALQTDEGIVTENPAILEFIATRYPKAELLPSTLFQQAQARALCAYLCATVHVAFAHGKRANRWTDDTSAMHTMRAKVPANLRDCATLLENHLVEGPWALGGQYSFCDPYLFLFEGWMAAYDQSLDAYPKLSHHAAAMRQRPATQAALGVHELD